MRVIVASSDAESAGWLEGVLKAAGVTVVLLPAATPDAPELAGAELLIADDGAAGTIGAAGPERRLLLVPRGHAVDVSRAMGGGFMDLLVVPAAEDDILAKVGRAVDHFLKPPKVVEDIQQVEELKEVVRRVMGSLSATAPSDGAAHELAEGMLSVFMLLTDSHETTERGAPGHSRKVGAIAREVSLELGSTSDAASWVELAGRLHDIGHVALAVNLEQANELDIALRRVIEAHARLGADILGGLGKWGLPVDAIRSHHERIDGSGYPKGLKGGKIPLEAQIVGVADVFEALTSERPWRSAEPHPDALDALRAGKGFDTEILDALEAVAGREISPARIPPRAPGPAQEPP